jgi:hypothetical protein
MDLMNLLQCPALVFAASSFPKSGICIAQLLYHSLGIKEKGLELEVHTLHRLES